MVFEGRRATVWTARCSYEPAPLPVTHRGRAPESGAFSSSVRTSLRTAGWMCPSGPVIGSERYYSGTAGGRDSLNESLWRWFVFHEHAGLLVERVETYRKVPSTVLATLRTRTRGNGAPATVAPARRRPRSSPPQEIHHFLGDGRLHCYEVSVAGGEDGVGAADPIATCVSDDEAAAGQVRVREPATGVMHLPHTHRTATGQKSSDGRSTRVSQ